MIIPTLENKCFCSGIITAEGTNLNIVVGGYRIQIENNHSFSFSK